MFKIDAEWHDQITAVKTSESGISAVEFAQYIGGGQQIPLFTIYCVTGTLRDYYIGRTDLLQLGQTSQAVYFARFSEDAQQSAIQIDANGVKERFSLLTQAWSNE